MRSWGRTSVRRLRDCPPLGRAGGRYGDGADQSNVVVVSCLHAVDRLKKAGAGASGNNADKDDEIFL